MRRQLPPSKLLVPPGPQAFPQRHFLGDSAVIVNHYSGFEKAIPAIPSLPGFKTSAGTLFFCMGRWSCDRVDGTKASSQSHNNIIFEDGTLKISLLTHNVAFLTSLSANLRLDPDLPSPLHTPTTFRHNGYSLQPLPPTPLHFSTLSASHDPYPSPAVNDVMSSTEPSAPAKGTFDDIPQLSTYTAESEDDRLDGLNLVADSVAQQRQVSSKMMIFHPITLSMFALVAAIAIQYTLKAYNEWLVVGTTMGGITMTFLVFIRWMTGGYITLAEDVGMDWLGDDRLIIVKWGEDVIGALVLGWADNDASKKRGRRRRGKAVVRAWTVKLKYRHKGIGESLLEEAVKVAGEKGADGIVFDADHASKSHSFVPVQSNTNILQTLSAFSPQSSTASSTNKKPPPKRRSRKSPTTKATSASARALQPGAADRLYKHIFLIQEGGFPIIFAGISLQRISYGRYPRLRSFRFTKIPHSLQASAFAFAFLQSRFPISPT